MKAKDRDYRHLEGLIVSYNDWEEILNALVVGCDYNVGITLVNAGNKDDYLLCLNGPSDVSDDERFSWKLHNTLFFTLVRQIKKGCVRNEILDRILCAYNYSSFSHKASAETCSFGK